MLKKFQRKAIAFAMVLLLSISTLAMNFDSSIVYAKEASTVGTSDDLSEDLDTETTTSSEDKDALSSNDNSALSDSAYESNSLKDEAKSQEQNSSDTVLEDEANSDSTDASEASEREQCSKVKASIEPGQVEKGQKVSFSCETEGAIISVSTTSESTGFSEYTNSIEINEDVTIYAFASADGYKTSEVSTFSYTVKAEEENDYFEVASDIKDGDQIIIYFANGKVALSDSASGSRLNGVSATVSDNKMEANDELTPITVSADSDGLYTLMADGKYLTCPATGNGLSFVSQPDEYSKWKFNVVDASNGTYEIINDKASYYNEKKAATFEQALEYYNNAFTAYSYTEGGSAFLMQVFNCNGFAPSEVTPEEDIDCLPLVDTLEDGNQIVIYHPSSKTTLTNTADGKKLKGINASLADGGLEKNDDYLVLTAVKDSDGNFEFVNDGKYLTSGATGSSLSFSDVSNDYSLWTVIEVDSKEGTYELANVNAKYTTGAQQYLEYYKGYTTYSLNNGGSAYEFQLYLYDKGIPTAKKYKIDDSINATIAQWAGNAGYYVIGDSVKINGDLFSTNDMLDESSTFSAYIDGKNVQPYQRTNPNGYQKGDVLTDAMYNYYMGAVNLGSTSNDYMLLETSSSGFANMTLSFRLRGTAAGAAGYQAQYSVDGENYYNFSTGTYAYSYTSYSKDSDGNTVQTPVSNSGDISDGYCKLFVEGKYVEFSFDVPEQANNADKLYIRLLASTSRLDGKTTDNNGKASKVGGNVRIDSVELTGNPIISSDQVAYIKATPESGEVAIDSTVELSSTTEGATIYYSLDGGKTFTTYSDDNKPVLSELPASIVAYGTLDGLKNSPWAVYQYTQSKVMTVTATPNGGAISKGQKVSLRCKTEGATILYAYVNADVDSSDDASEESTEDSDTDTESSDDLDWKEYSEPISITKLPASIKVKAVKEGYLDSAVATLNYTERQNEKYNIYFGQIHSHTNFSDGAGTPEEAFEHASNVDNLDFFCVTDHSNSLDNADVSDLTTNVDTSAEDEWTKGHELAEQYSTDDFTCIYGFEMTWSNGLGHMNTFNTPGFQSRTQKDYATYSTALQNYYAKLNQVPDSASMFNHPGTTFGDFQDFAYYSEANDALITMIEVGNGEGTIGSSGYFPSYEYYTRALDKGWHVAPANNQDNHKGKWGDANTARTVVLADTNTEANIYDAMKNCRMYATEDNDLKIYYTLDGYDLGTQLEKDAVGDTVNIKVELSDSTDDAIGKVEVIVNGGLSIASKDVTTNSETVEFNVPSSYSYYYIKVTQADKDIAVTAPVWVGKVEACGINDVNTTTALPVAGEMADINVDFFNNEKSDLELESMTFSIDKEVIKDVSSEDLENANLSKIDAKGTGTYTMYYTPEKAGSVKIDVSVNAKLDGVQKVYNGTITIKYTAPSLVTNVIVDGTHYNDYVTGYYGGNITNFVSLAAEKSMRVVIEKEEITKEQLEDCAVLVLSAPAKKSGTAGAGDYTVSHYSDEFIELVKDYVANGGTVIVCGLADYSDTTACQTATEQNKLLSAIGSTIRMNSDEAWDDDNNGGQQYRLYPNNFNMDSNFLSGVVSGQKYSQYSGCTVDVTNTSETDIVYAAEALVSGYDTTYSMDCKDDNGNKYDDGNHPAIEKGTAVFLGHQVTKAGGDIFVAGGVFLSDFEIKAELDNNDDLQYANRNIVLNILETKEKTPDVIDISSAREKELGDIICVEGYVIAGTSNHETTFFDSIYIQDDTAGIDVFPYSEEGLEIGTKIKVTGYIDQYQGDKEIQVISTKVLNDEPKKVYEPKTVSTKDAMDYEKNGGSLLNTVGTVTRITYLEDGKTVSEFWLKDDTGVEAAIFIDGYITSLSTGENKVGDLIKVGDTVSATGILYMHPEGDSDVSVPVFRVRNTDEITLVKEETSQGGQSTTSQSESNGTSSSAGSSKTASSQSSQSTSSDEQGAEATSDTTTIVDTLTPTAGNGSDTDKQSDTNSTASSNVDLDSETNDADTSNDATEEESVDTNDETSIDDSETPKALDDKQESNIPVIPVAAATIVIAAGLFLAFKFGLLGKLLLLFK